MARIAPSDRRFRTQEQIVEDVAFMLTAPVTYGTKFAVLKDAMWVWTERDGKYEGCPYWTVHAFIEYCAARTERTRNKHKRLRHEHVVPKSVVMQLLDDLKSPTHESVRAILDKFLIGVVVSLEEDAILNKYRSKMPGDFYDPKNTSYHDPWLRYKACTIDPVPVSASIFDDVDGFLAKYISPAMK